MPAQAQAAQVGLLARGYLIGNDIPPSPSDSMYPSCGIETVPFINVTFDYEQNLFGGCGWDQYMILYTGMIQIPPHETIEFWVASDDGGMVKIGTKQFGVWQDQGCSATLSGPMNIDAGNYVFNAAFYENGGGTCMMLAWNIDDQGWTIVPPEAFTSEPFNSTTIPSTTEPQTTTTQQPASFTTVSGELLTSGLNTTSTVTLTNTTETISSNPPSSVAATTTEQPQISIQPQETIASVYVITEPITETTLEPIPVTTDSPIPETASTEPETTTTTSETYPDTTVETIVTTEETFVDTIVAEQDDVKPILSDADLSLAIEKLSALSDADPEEVQAIVDTLLENDLSTEQALTVLIAPNVLAALTADQATAVFEEIKPAELSTAMAEVIADVLNGPDVPVEVKEAFEATLNIFGNDGFGGYVPLGSTVPVSTRRVLIAATAVVLSVPATPIGAKSERKKG